MKRLFIILFALAMSWSQSCKKEETEDTRIQRELSALDAMIRAQQAEGGFDSEAFLRAMNDGVVSFTKAYGLNADGSFRDCSYLVTFVHSPAFINPVLFKDDGTWFTGWLDNSGCGYDDGTWSYDVDTHCIASALLDKTDRSKVLYYKDNTAILDGAYPNILLYGTYARIREDDLPESYRLVVAFDKVDRKRYIWDYEQFRRAEQLEHDKQQQQIAEEFDGMDSMIRAQQADGGIDSGAFLDAMYGCAMIFSKTYAYTDREEWTVPSNCEYDLIFMDDGTYWRRGESDRNPAARQWSYDGSSKIITFGMGDIVERLELLYFKDNVAIIEGNFSLVYTAYRGHSDQRTIIRRRYVVEFDSAARGQMVSEYERWLDTVYWGDAR